MSRKVVGGAERMVVKIPVAGLKVNKGMYSSRGIYMLFRNNEVLTECERLYRDANPPCFKGKLPIFLNILPILTLRFGYFLFLASFVPLKLHVIVKTSLSCFNPTIFWILYLHLWIMTRKGLRSTACMMFIFWDGRTSDTNACLLGRH